MSDKRYLEYELTSDILCLGERVKKGIFKPCIRTIPFSSITGALRETFNNQNIFAVGKLDEIYLKEIDKFRQIHVYSPRYRCEDVAKVPLQIEYLTNVQGRVYISLQHEDIEGFRKEVEKCNEISLGAFKSKGFGRCRLSYVQTINSPAIKTGILQSRIPEKHLPVFGISEVKKPIYGYLFEPDSPISGKYIKSLFEGSLVKGYDFLIKEVGNDRTKCTL